MRARISDFCCWCWGDLPKSVVENLVCTVRSENVWMFGGMTACTCTYLACTYRLDYMRNMWRYTLLITLLHLCILVTGPRQRYPLDTHDKNQNESYERTTRILLLFLMLLLPDVDGDARSHSASRGTTVHHVVMLSVPLLFIVGIFSLASMRERDMDLHHSQHHEKHVQTWCW